MVNFGGIEFLSFVWIERLSKDPILHEVSLTMQLGRRIEIINKLVERSAFSKKLNSQIRAAWKKAEKLAETRNHIAHSPIVFGWRGPETNRLPDYLGSLSIKKLKGKSKTVTEPLILMGRLNQEINEAAALAQQLRDILDNAIEEMNGGLGLTTDE